VQTQSNKLVEDYYILPTSSFWVKLLWLNLIIVIQLWTILNSSKFFVSKYKNIYAFNEIIINKYTGWFTQLLSFNDAFIQILVFAIFK